jgi:hypothetical protein
LQQSQQPSALRQTAEAFSFIGFDAVGDAMLNAPCSVKHDRCPVPGAGKLACDAGNLVEHGA